MIKEELATGSVGSWQQLALVFFMVVFAVVTVMVYRRGSKERLEPYRDVPLADDSDLSSSEGSR